MFSYRRAYSTYNWISMRSCNFIYCYFMPWMVHHFHVRHFQRLNPRDIFTDVLWCQILYLQKL